MHLVGGSAESKLRSQVLVIEHGPIDNCGNSGGLNVDFKLFFDRAAPGSKC